MAQNKPFRLGPIALTTTLTTNLLNPGTTTGGTNTTAAPNASLFVLIRYMRVTNKTGGAATFTLYIGATGANAAGTEVALQVSVAANSYVEWYPPNLRFDVADFLVGGASANTTLTLMATGEIGVV